MSYKTNPVSNRFDISLGWYGKFNRNSLAYTTTIQNYIQFHAMTQAFLLTKKIYVLALQYCKTSFIADSIYTNVLSKSYLKQVNKVKQSINFFPAKVKKRYLLRKTKTKQIIKQSERNRTKWNTNFILFRKEHYSFLVKINFYNSSISTKKFFYYKITQVKSH